MKHFEDKFVSVIMPMYNSEKYIEESIQSVINQTYLLWELIIIDDGSQDQSVNKGMVSITVPANTVTSLPVAPAYTSFATVKFVNGTYWVRTDGVAPTVGVAGNASPYVTRDELQLFNNDITGFRVISSTATRIVVEWRNHQHVMAQ